MKNIEHEKIERGLLRLARKQVKQLSEHKGPLVEKLKVKAALAETREVLRLHRLNRFNHE